jgi:serine/threonine protein kinase
MAEVIRGGRVLLMSKNAKQLVHDVLSIRECRPKDLTVVNKLPIRDDWPKKENTIFRAQIENWPSNIAKPNKEPIPLVFKQDEQDLKEKCLDLIASILQFDPQVRPSADRVLAHPFFADIHKNEPVPCTKKYEVLDSCLVSFVQEKCGGFT